MKLDSVRELKQSLPGKLSSMLADRTSARRSSSVAVASAASLHRSAPSYFLGVTAKGKTGNNLAVCLQDRALEKSELVARISASAKGEVDVRYAGRIRARATRWYRSKQRPLLIGSSVGFIANGFIMAGTLDGGNPTSDRVAKLTRFVRLTTGQPNLIDCATAKLNANAAVDLHKLRGIGTLAGQREGKLEIGDIVHKVGRTAGVRHGRVTAFELDGLEVEYDIGVVSFDDQIEIEGSRTRSFSDSGDSGSLIVDDDHMGAALLFAGSDHGGRNGEGLIFANPLSAVLKALKVRLA